MIWGNMKNIQVRCRSAISSLFLTFPITGGLGTIEFAVAQSSPRDIPAEVFGALPANQTPKLSPDGTAFALIIPHQGRKHVLIRPTDGKGKSVVLPPYEDSEIRWIEWANNERLLIGLAYTSRRFVFRGQRVTETRLLSASRDGTDVINMVRGTANKKSIAGGRATIVYSRAQIQDYIIDFLYDDPEHILLALNHDLDPDQSYEVRRVKVASGLYKNISRGRRFIQDWTTDKQGILRFGEGYRDETMKATYRNPRTNQWQLMDGKPIQDDYSLWSFFEDPQFAYVTGKNESGIRALFKFDMIEQKVVETVYEHEKFDVQRILFRPYGRDPIGITLTTDRIETHYFDPAWSKRQRMLDAALKGYVNRIISSTRDNNLHIVESTSDVESGAYYLFDEKSKQLHFLDVKYRGLEPKMLSPMTFISYEARDGWTIPAYLTIPRGMKAENLPTVIMPHGGPRSRDLWRYHYRAQFLASRGYAVFQPNFRGSSGYGAGFMNAGDKNWGLKMQDDVTDGVKMLIEKGIADPTRICIVGASYGGYAALMGAVKTPDLFACAVSISGVSNLPGLVTWEHETKVGGKIWTRSIGDPGEDRTVLRETSPYHQAKKIKIPILLIHSKDDTRVPVGHSRAMADRLKGMKKSVVFVEIESGGHTLEVEAARIAVLKALEKFLAKHIGG